MLASRMKITDPPPELSGHSPLIAGVFEPPSGFAPNAIARHKLLVCAVAVLCAALGLAYGVSRQPRYTASATLQVGQVNPNSPGFYGYVQSAAALASAFSRAVAAEPVLAAVQQKLKLPPAVAGARLSAEPIPVSPAFRVIATGPSAPAAVALANVAAAALIDYESESNSANPQAATLLHEYAEASFALQRANASFVRLAHDKRASAEARLRAGAARTAAQVKLKAIGNSYVGAVTSQAPRSGLVTLLAGASSASSDHRSKIEMFALIGLLAGIVLGCLGAMLRERRAVEKLVRRADAELQASPSL
jgi:capsular polysaccharide biosynthesis protein